MRGRKRPNIATSYYSNIDLLSKGIPITNKIAATIRQKYGSTEMRTYLCNKFDWVSSTCDTIDWLCHGRALSRLPNTNQVFVVKLIHEWLPLHQQKHHFNRHHTHLCPICRQHIENPNHFLRCTATPYNQPYSKLLRAICQHCEIWECHPDTTRLLLLGIQHWPRPVRSSFFTASLPH